MVKAKKTPEAPAAETTVAVIPESHDGKAAAKDEKDIQVIAHVIENKEIATKDAFGKLSRAQLDLLKRTIAKGASDDELKLFIQVCKGANLNPFMKQVHLIPRWDSKEGREVRTIQVSIDGFRAIAEDSGGYAGNEDPVFDGDNVLEFETGTKEKPRKETLTTPNKATVTVYKIVQGVRYPFTATARWSEYYPGAKLGFQWHIKPYLMLGKCAEALALRKAFPKLLSGMYVAEEMDKGAEPGSQGSDEQKTASSFKKLMEMAQTAKLDELVEFKAKFEASDKYTPAQKKEFAEVTDLRIKNLQELENIGDAIV